MHSHSYSQLRGSSLIGGYSLVSRLYTQPQRATAHHVQVLECTLWLQLSCVYEGDNIYKVEIIIAADMDKAKGWISLTCSF